MIAFAAYDTGLLVAQVRSTYCDGRIHPRTYAAGSTSTASMTNATAEDVRDTSGKCP